MGAVPSPAQVVFSLCWRDLAEILRLNFERMMMIGNIRARCSSAASHAVERCPVDSVCIHNGMGSN